MKSTSIKNEEQKKRLWTLAKNNTSKKINVKKIILEKFINKTFSDSQEKFI